MTLQKLVESVRRREIVQLIAGQAMIALTIGAGGMVLLLLLGTQVLDWYWPVLLALVSFGYLIFKVRSRIPAPYKVAQVIDHRMRTADLLSSAWHFQNDDRAAKLRAAAEQAASGIDPAAAAPWASPRGWGRATAVSVAALSLLVFRYAFQTSLDLERPIAPGLYSLLASGEKPKELAKKQAKGEEAMPFEGVETTQARNGEEQKGLEKGQEIETETSNSTESGQSGQKPGQFQQTMSPSEEGENIEGAEKGEGASREGEDGESKEDKKDAADSAKKNKPDPSQNNGNQKGDNSSLMDKFKDAMANLMNKMKSQDKNQGQSQQTKDNQQGQQGAGQQEQKASKGQESQGKQQAQGQQQQSDQQGQQQGEGGEKSPNQQAKGGDKGGQPPSSDAKSGMGKQDGSKSIELAQQQDAMGKISELFGKRAQNIQGEIMIEVSSSKSQQLKTGYTGKNAAHSDKGGIIRRDEVPIELQNYVQKYFEEIRKPAAKSN